MTLEEQEQLHKIAREYIQGQGRCVVCKLNMGNALAHKQDPPDPMALSSPCQQCQNHILEQFIRAMQENANQ